MNNITINTIIKIKILFLTLLFSVVSWGQTPTVTSQTTAGNYSFTVPVGVSSITIDCYGAGGGGGGTGANYTTAGGAAGGSYVKFTYAVTPGATFNYTVGAGGTIGSTGGSDGGTGNNSFFGNTTAGSSIGALVLAVGGAGGKGNSTAGSGSSNFSGGALGGVGTNSGNLPASGATTNTAGNNGTTSIGGVNTAATSGTGGTSTGPNAGAGGAGWNNNSNNGAPGTAPGGGGGGGYRSTGIKSGGLGGDGGVYITYSLPYNFISYNTTTTWPCPTGVSQALVYCWGGGGAGGSAKGSASFKATGGGGAGGAFAGGLFSTTGGTSYTVTVGAGGVTSATNGAVGNGSPSWFNTVGTIYAVGGAGGVSKVVSSAAVMGAGGVGSSSGNIGTTITKGGDGYTSTGATVSSAGGGGSGGSSAAGTSATSSSGAAAGLPDGGSGGSGASSGADGSIGSTPGGGGGGAWATTSTSQRNGGTGGVGQVIVYCYAVPALTLLSPSSAAAGSATFTLTVTGTNFFSGVSAIIWNGVSLTTVYLNSTTLTASISASLIITPGTVPVGVVNSGTYGVSTSTSTLPFTITGTTYTVTYDGNTNTGGTAPVDASSPYASGATVTVKTLGTLVKSGYTFTGWNTVANGTGTAYAGSGSATFTIAANTTLYAQWVVTSSALCPASTACTPSGIQNVCQGSSASQLTATATNSGSTGSPTISYQWYYNTTNSNTISGATTVGGATSSTYTPLSTATEVGTRYYFCVAYATDNTCAQTSASQSLASNQVQVVVTGTPATPSAGSLGTCSGGTLSLTSSTVSSATYAWTGPNSYTSSSQNPTVSASATTGMSGTYSVVASINGCPGAAGSTVVTINTTPTAPTAGSNTPVCAGASLALTASTVASATYAWSGPSSYTSTSQNPTVSASATAAMAGTYSVTATVSGCTSSAGTTVVAVNAITTIGTQPSNASAIAPATASFTVAATGTSLTYQWQISTNSGGSWANVSTGSGGTSATYTTESTSAGMTGNQYQCIVSGTCGSSSTSSVATLTISTGPCLSDNLSGFAAASHGTPDTTDVSGSLDTYTQTAGWTGAKIYRAGGEIKLGTGSLSGNIVTPTVSLSAGAYVTFDIQQYSTDTGLIQVFHAPDGVTFTQVGSDITPTGSYVTQTVSITGGTSLSKIKIGTSAKRAYLDNISVYCGTACTAPSAQASFTSTANIGVTQMDINFGSGTGGNGRLVVIKAGSAVAGTPTSGTSYSGYTSNFSTTTQTIATGEKVVYKGATSPVTVTGLTAETQYYVSVFEYNSTGDCYITSGSGNTGSRYTLSTEPTGQPTSGLSATTCSATTMSVTVPAPSTGADGYLLIYKAGGVPTGLPTDGNAYSAPASTFGDATVGAIVTSASTVTVSGLSANTAYYFQLVPYNSNSGLTAQTYNYLTSGTLLQTNYTTSASGASTASTVDTDTGYTYTTNIAYASYQAASVASAAASVGVHSFIIKDGGATTDADVLPTILNAISYTYTGTASTIRAAALFTTGGTKIADGTVSANGIAFTSLSGANVTASDGGTTTVVLRVTFSATVTDNERLVFTVSSVTAGDVCSSSQFAAANGGGAVSSSTGDNNRIEVTADRLAFVVQPVTTSINTAMAAVTVSANDGNGNRDLDFANPVSVASTGTLTGTPVSGSVASGLATFSSLTHTVAETGRTLTATTTGLTTNTIGSGTFDITTIVYANGDYRTILDGNWHSTSASGSANTWQQYVWGNWTAYSNSPPAGTTANVYIRHSITLIGTNTASNITIENGGILNTSTITPTFTDVLVKSGGTFKQDGYVKFNGTIEVEDGGYYQFNSKNTSSKTTTVWNGTEKFHPNSYFVISNADTTGNYTPFDTEGEISLYTNPATGYSACFGNIIIDNSAGSNLQLLPTPFTKNLTHGDLTFRSNASSKVLCSGAFTTEIGGNLIVEAAYNQTITLLLSANTVNFKVKGNLINNSVKAIRLLNNASGTANTTVEGDVQLNSTSSLDLNFTTSGVSTLNLKGDLSVASGALLFATASTAANNVFNFTGTGDGITAATTQTIDVASGSGLSTRNQYINFFVNTGAYVQLINQDLQLGINSKFTVNGSGSTGGTLDFNFSGTTALNITSYSTGTNFSSLQASTLKISSPDGINNTSGTVGNVQTTNAPTYHQTATFWYLGKVNQVTGTGLSIGSTPKIVYVNLLDNTKTLTLTNKIGIAGTTTLDALGGRLEIQKGTLLGSTNLDFYGSGRLVMSDGEYKISTITTTPASDYLPQLSGYSSYSLTGGTVNLSGTSATDNQILSGTPTYYKLAFSGSNVLGTNYKGLSTATNVTNSITISETAVVDVKSFSLGGSPNTPSFTMTGTSRYITDGGGTKPDAGGAYTLGATTTIEFANSSGAGVVRLGAPTNYANVIVSGSDVSNISAGTGIKFQSGGTFTVKDTGVFKLFNTAGFTGSTVTAINNTNSPAVTLESLSTVEYSGTNDQTVTTFSPYYAFLKFSGSGIKTVPASLSANTTIDVNKDLTVTGVTLQVNNNDKNLNSIYNTYLTVTNQFINSAGTVNFEDGSSLIQVTDPVVFPSIVNSGNVNYKRIANIRKTDYVYWSTPVTAFGVNNIWATNSFIYKWNTIVANSNAGFGNWQSASGATMTNGVGYILRGPSGTSLNSTPSDYSATFAGVPNNGTITVPILKGDYTGADYPGTNGVTITKYDDNMNLIGNPYPSAINALDFIAANDKIEGSIQVWTHGTQLSNSIANPFYGSFSYNYSSNDYITYNYLGESSGPSTFNGYIGAGQAFFVKMLDAAATGSNVTFTNTMRYKTYANNRFYRIRNPHVVEPSINDSNPVERNRIWLDLIAPTGTTVRTLVGYIAGATLDKDRLYDAYSDYENDQNLFSLIGKEIMTIQGRPLPFDVNDTVPMGVAIPKTGNYTIAIGVVDGLFAGGQQTIYLEDKLLNVIHNLSVSPYSFNIDKGIVKDRFVLRYTDGALGAVDFKGLNNSVVVASGSNQITIKSFIEDIKSIVIYDVLGREIFAKNNVNAMEFLEKDLNLSQQTLLVKIALANGQTVVKKIVY